MSEYKISTENETWYPSGDGEIFDKVTNPKHYKGINGLEVIEVHKNFMTNLWATRRYNSLDDVCKI